MAQLGLRPLGVGEIVEVSFTLYRRRFGPMIGITLLFVFVPYLVGWLGGCTLDTDNYYGTTCSSATGWIGEVVSWFGALAAHAAATLVAAEANAGVSSDWRRSTGLALRRLLPILALSIVLGIVIGVGFVALVVPGIFLAVSLAVSTPALMVEGIGPMASIGRSWRLVSGERWRLLGAGLAMIAILVIGFGTIGAVIFLVTGGIVGLSDDLAIILSTQMTFLSAIPLSASVATVLYLDLLVRKEGIEASDLATQPSAGD